MIDAITPTERKFYIIVPVGAGVTIGLGAGLLSLGASLPGSVAAYNTVGAGLVATGTGILVAAVCIASERAEWWRYRTALTERELIPSAPQSVNPEPAPNLITTEKGPAVYDRETNTLRFVKGYRKNAPASQGMTTYSQQLTQVIGRVILEQVDDEGAPERATIDVNMGLWRLAKYGAADANISTREGDWVGQNKPFTLAEFRMMRDWMIGQGYGEWISEKSHTQGWRIVSKGRAVLKYLETKPTPLPERKVVVNMQEIG